MTGGSQQLRLYRRARRDGLSVASACSLSGIGIGEAQFIEAEDARNAPPPEAYELLSSAPAVGANLEEGEMAKKAKPGDAGAGGVTNLSETKEAVKDAVAKILKLRNERKELNAAIGEQRARVKNYGVPPAALDLAIRMKEADAEDRQRHDEGYAIARDALGLGLQRSLFETLDQDLNENAQKPNGGVAGLEAARVHLTGVGSHVPDAMN